MRLKFCIGPAGRQKASKLTGFAEPFKACRFAPPFIIFKRKAALEFCSTGDRSDVVLDVFQYGQLLFDRWVTLHYSDFAGTLADDDPTARFFILGMSIAN